MKPWSKYDGQRRMMATMVVPTCLERDCSMQNIISMPILNHGLNSIFSLRGVMRAKKYCPITKWPAKMTLCNPRLQTACVRWAFGIGKLPNADMV